MSIINCWSVLNAVIIGTCMGFVFHIVISRLKLTYKEGITPYLIVLIMIVLRSILPLDLTQLFIIPSEIVLVELDEFLKNSIIWDVNLISIIIFTWVTGSIIAVFKWINNLFRVKKAISLIKQTSIVLPEKYRDIAQSIGLVPERIMVSKAIDIVVTVGAFDYCVIIPDMDYSAQDMKNILRHEADHIYHRDIFVKMMIHIASCLMWWNPLLLFLEKDFSLLIEYRCDDNAVKDYSVDEKISYVETIKKMATLKVGYPCQCNAVGFAIASEKSALFLRAKRVLFNQNRKMRWTTALLYMLMIILFLGSYTVQAQPAGDPGYIEDRIIITPKNAYLRPNQNGYDMYVDGVVIDHIEKSDLNMGPYNRLEIKGE